MADPERPSGAIALAEAVEWRAGERAAGRRVAFTNGCFDILHAGHARLLAAARECADALIVAVNTDDSVRRLKGRGRPLVPAGERAELIAALESVDRVVLFDEDTPLETIVALAPDVLVKGEDWPEDRIVGASEVRAAGGEIVRVPLVEGASTSEIVRRVLERYGRTNR